MFNNLLSGSSAYVAVIWIWGKKNVFSLLHMVTHNHIRL